MRILFVSHGGRRNGGAQNVLFSLMKHCAPLFECHCLFPENGQFADSVVAMGIQKHVVRFNWWAGFELDTIYKISNFCMNLHKSVDSVVDIINRNKIDMVVSNTVVMAEGAFAAQICGIPHIWYIHEILSKDPKLKHLVKLEFLYPLMLHMSHSLVGVSNAVKSEITHYLDLANKERDAVQGEGSPLKFPLEKIHVVHNGVPIPTECPEINSNNTVLSVGGICRRKGQMALLRAARIVLDEIPDAKFRLAGSFWENGYRRELLDERIRLDIGKKFAFEKWQNDMDAFYSSGGVLVSPSTCESFGLSLLEGMTHGLPVVTTDSGGPSEIVLNGETGFIVPVNDHHELADRIISLLKNKDIGKKMGRAGFERVKENFSEQKFLDGFTKLILKEGRA
jgi:glycosyltransferase involved in cell wall biosynthesis